MKSKFARGWFKESHRHYLAAKGITTSYFRKRRKAEDVARLGRGPAMTPPSVKAFKKGLTTGQLPYEDFLTMVRRQELQAAAAGRGPKKSQYAQRFKGITFEQGMNAREKAAELLERKRALAVEKRELMQELRQRKKSASDYEDAGGDERAESERAAAEELGERVEALQGKIDKLIGERKRELQVAAKAKAAAEALVPSMEGVARYGKMQKEIGESLAAKDKAELEQVRKVRAALLKSGPVADAGASVEQLKKRLATIRRKASRIEGEGLDASSLRSAETELIALIAPRERFVASQERLTTAKALGTGMVPVLRGVRTPLGPGSITVGKVTTPEGEKIIARETVQPIVERKAPGKEPKIPWGKRDVIRSVRETRRESAAEGAEEAPTSFRTIFQFKKGHAPWRAQR